MSHILDADPSLTQLVTLIAFGVSWLGGTLVLAIGPFISQEG